jgi:hypothetical protein
MASRPRLAGGRRGSILLLMSAEPADGSPDKATLAAELAALPARSRVAFALACAERLVAYSRHVAGSATYELAGAARALARRFVAGEVIAAEEFEALVARLESSPDIDDDDVAAGAFVLECMRSGDVQSAVWAADRGFDARMRAAERGRVFSVYTPEIDAALLADPAVQTELACQRKDLDSLKQDRVPDTDRATARAKRPSAKNERR